MNLKFYSKTLLVIATITSCYLKVNGQEGLNSSTIPVLNLIPSSPDASSLGKYGNLPVSLNTGVPSINIPIYTINLKKINIPISISYHSGGITVNETASRVGLGWTLFAGGAITCNVNGLPDLELKGWRTNSGRKLIPQTLEDIKISWEDNFTYQAEPEYFFIRDIVDNKIDSQPDVFNLNVLGRNFKFFFDQDGKIYTMPYQRVSLSYNSINQSFTFIDENDNTYLFSYGEVSTTDYTYYDGANFDQFNSFDPTQYVNKTFYLTSITTPYSETVTFEYDDETQEIKNQKTETRFVAKPGYQGPGCPDNYLNTKITVSETTTYGRKLKKITTSGGHVVNFNYSNSRLDINGGTFLQSISVNYLNNIIPITKFDLTHSYFTGPSVYSNDYDNKKLKLNTIKEIGKNPYVFEYDSVGMPYRMSLGQDHWGYYNGKNEHETTLCPRDDDRGFYTGSDRSPDSNYMKKGILTKIKYPTGGESTFYYQPNIYTELIEHPAQTESSVEYYPEYPDHFTEPFTIPTGAYDFKAFFTGSENVSSVKILNSSHVEIRSFYGDSPITGTAIANLPAGNYYLDIDAISFEGSFLKISYKHPPIGESTSEYVDKMSGGLRIQKIVDNDNNGNILVKNYEYLLPNSNQSSGHMRAVNYVNNHYHHNFVGGQYVACMFYAQASQNTYLSHSNIEYTNVREYINDKTSNGFTDYTFSLAGGGNDPDYPFVPGIIDDWMGGHLLEKKVFSYDINKHQYSPVTKEVNTYKLNFSNSDDPILHEKTISGIKAVLNRPAYIYRRDALDGNLGPEFIARFYYLHSTWIYQTSKQTTTYDPADSTKRVITLAQYYLDNPEHIEITREEVSKSTGEKYKVLKRYLKDYNSNYAYNSSPVVEERVMVNNGATDRLVSGKINTFANQAGALPLSYYSLKNTSALTPSTIPLYTGTVNGTYFEKRQDYVYNIHNEVKEVIKEGVYHTIYLYSYNGQYPVAKIENASSVAIESAMGGAAAVETLRNLASPTDIYIKSTMATLRANLPQSMVTSYTYNPLVGMTSETDVKGMTRSYEYDEFQRLKYVRDHEGNIIKATDYHYKP